MNSKKAIQLSDHFGFKQIILFTIPSIGMMLFTSIYGVVDGFFISNTVGETAFAAVNFIYPFLGLFGAFGFLLGTGGTALVSRLLGSRDPQHAKEVFSFIICLSTALGFLFILLGELTLRPAAMLLGAEGELLEQCMIYGRIYLLGTPAFILQYSFQTFMITAEKPKLGLCFTVAAGVSNMILDALFMAVFHWGVTGAAAATVIGQCIGGIGPLIYFLRPNDSLLRLTKPKLKRHDFPQILSNGAAEFLTNVSISVVGAAYNFQLLRLLGEYGVSAYGIIMYVSFIFIGVYVGFSMGISPVIGFHFGAGNRNELKSLLRKCLILIGFASVILTAAAELASGFLTNIFAGYDAEFLALSRHAFRIYSINYIIAGINVFAPFFFAAIGNGLASVTLSFLRVLLFQLICIFVTPLIFGVDGIWLSVIFAEGLTVLFSVFFLLKNRKRYGY